MIEPNWLDKEVLAKDIELLGALYRTRESTGLGYDYKGARHFETDPAKVLAYAEQTGSKAVDRYRLKHGAKVYDENVNGIISKATLAVSSGGADVVITKAPNTEVLVLNKEAIELIPWQNVTEPTHGDWSNQCPVCHKVFPTKELDSHEHTMADLPAGYGKLRVSGIGRVGSYAAAKQAHRCRNHRYWAICYFDSRPGKAERGYLVKRGEGECSDSPHFKTRHEAQEYLDEHFPLNMPVPRHRALTIIPGVQAHVPPRPTLPARLSR